MYLCTSMKKIFTYPVSLILAALIFYGGAGVNLISYCCNLCRSEGIEAVSNDKCCEIHHHHHTGNHQIHHMSGCCELVCNTHSEDNHNNRIQDYCGLQDDQSTGECCSFERINFEWNIRNLSKQETCFSFLTLDLFSCIRLTSVDLRLANKIHSQIPHGPPIVFPRDYLSILTVLLI